MVPVYRDSTSAIHGSAPLRHRKCMANGSLTIEHSSPMRRIQELIFPLAIIGSVLVILVPLPPALMDVLLASNISIAVLVLLTTIYIRNPLELSIFPSLLLATTLGRLVLN